MHFLKDLTLGSEHHIYLIFSAQVEKYELQGIKCMKFF